MAQIHELVLTHGRQKARELVTGKSAQAIVDIAADILAEENNSLGITYSGFCLTALPHKRIPDDHTWERRSKRLTLVIDPGSLRIDGQLRKFGVPYGSRARMILIYLQTRAIQTGSPEIELGRSMNEWLARMGLSVGGKTYLDIREQANRISACNLSFFWDGDAGEEGFEKSSIVRGGIRLRAGQDDDRQGSLWHDTVRLSDTFFKALEKHPVPVWEPALREISNRSMSIDIYVWLAYRLHSLSKPQKVSWQALFDQFGAGFASSRSFRQKFKEALEFALAVYPDAKLEVIEQGLLLHPSRPPIPSSIIHAVSWEGASKVQMPASTLLGL